MHHVGPGGGHRRFLPALEMKRGVFLTGLALLVVNDWLLKGAGWLPGWFTGKLSDAAGLVVAPVVLATVFALARVPIAVARGLAVAFVAVVFAAIKVDAGFAAGFDAIVNAVVGGFASPWPRARSPTGPISSRFRWSRSAVGLPGPSRTIVRCVVRARCLRCCWPAPRPPRAR